MTIVLDTSVVAKIFIAEQHRDSAVNLISAGIRQEITLLAPSLLLYELNNVLISKGIKGAEYAAAVSALMEWVRARVINVVEADEDLLRRAEVIASIDTQGQGYISSYDATFHAPALREGAVFVTSDEAYVRKTRDLLGRVELLPSFTV